MRLSKVLLAISLILNVLLLAVLVLNFIAPRKSSPIVDDASAAASEEPGAAEVMGAGGDGTGSDSVPQWIDKLKTLALKHNVDAFFLQELFPENIVYKHKGSIIYAEVDETLPQHAYDWEHLRADENGVLRYEDAEGLTGVFGIDVSKYQGPINWQKVKDAGVGFVIIRVGYRGYGNGEMKMDDYFEDYMRGASEVGLPIGVYFFSQAITPEEAVEEADYVINAVNGRPLAYPVVFDMEEIAESPNRTEFLTPEEITDISIAFCDRVKGAGYQPMIYGNVSWFLAQMQLDRLHEYDKWFAQYRPMPYYPYEFTMWQYSHRGSVDGIEGDVDMNISFVDYAAE